MIPTGLDHACGHPMVVDCLDDTPRCAVCTARPWWRYRRPRTQYHRFREAA